MKTEGAEDFSLLSDNTFAAPPLRAAAFTDSLSSEAGLILRADIKPSVWPSAAALEACDTAV